MAKIKYVSNCVTKSDLPIIIMTNKILQKFAGYRMTLRQLFYQFVARGLLPNDVKKYKKLCKAIQNGRIGGMIDWSVIEDRTRSQRSLSHWDDPSSILDACAEQFHVDYWQNQKCRTEVWIEKDALLGVIEKTCNQWDCPYFSCRGYSSISELHEASLRIKRFEKSGQDFKILYCGDHDPSGIDMGGSIVRTLKNFGTVFTFDRIALNIEQIKQYNPPPNPVKKSDTRSNKYRNKFGDECWELDSLSPQVLNEIVETAIIGCIDDMDDFNSRRDEDIEGRNQLRLVGNHFDEAHNYLYENKLKQLRGV